MFSFLPAMLTLALSVMLAGCSTVSPSGAAPTHTAVPEVIIRVSGSGTAMPLVTVLAEAYILEHPGVRFEFDDGTNSGGAIQGVLQDTLDLAVANRPLSADEAATSLEQHAFARDAIVFVTHLTDPIESLTTAQIRGIYSGRLTNWAELGGEAVPMIVLDRDADESARKLVLIPLMYETQVRARSIVLASASDMVTAVTVTPNSIGYSSLGLMRLLQPPGVQVVALDGVIPAAATLVNGDYPWSAVFRLIHGHDAPPAVQDFVRFVMSVDGQQILARYELVAVDE